MHITLSAWAERNFNPAPCLPTLIKWAKNGAISPPPIKVRGWMVDENAVYLDATETRPSVSGRVADILRKAA